MVGVALGHGPLDEVVHGGLPGNVDAGFLAELAVLGAAAWRMPTDEAGAV